MALLLTIVFIVASTLLLLSLRALAVTGVPVVHMSPAVVEAALDLLELRDGEVFYDLGCGAGNVLLAARRRADVRAVGLELNPAVALFAALRSALDKSTRVHLKDVRKARLAGADAIYAFLMPTALAEVSGHLESEVREGTRVVTVDFVVPGWRLEKERQCKGGHAVHLYVMGKHLP